MIPGALPSAWACCLAALCAAFPAQAVRRPAAFHERIAALEERHGGRLGVAALDAATGARLEYRSSERFALCSTFKLVLVAAVLARVDGRTLSLDRRVAYGEADLLDYAPVAKAHRGEGGLTVEALCAAAIEVSDNTAANLLLDLVGGPRGVTAFARSLGDSVTRLDRNEPSLNSNLPDDVRDTTSPAAMLQTTKRILTGRTLSPASRERLERFLRACTTGSGRLRAGVPASWRAGDKTGTCDNEATNDVAILWPPGRPPIFVTVYYSGSVSPLAEREAVLAEVGRLVVTGLGPAQSPGGARR